MSADPTGTEPRAPAGTLLDLPMRSVLWRVAVPATAAYTMNTLFGLVDAFFIGRLGADAMASLSSGAIVSWILLSVGALGQVGAQAIVSQSVGAGDRALAKRAAGAAMALLSVVAVLVLVPLGVLDLRLFRAMGLAPAVAQGAADYLDPVLVGMAFYFPTMVGTSVFHATGDARTPALVLGGSLLLNGLLDPLFIFGLGPVPAMGLAGAGLASLCGRVLFAATMLALLVRRGLVDLRAPADRSLLRLAARTFDIGYPIALNGALFSAAYLVLIRILSGFGTAPVATLGIAHRIEGVAWFTCVGFGVAAAALTGQSLGAGRVRGAIRSAWHVAGWLSVLLGAASVAFIAFGGPIVRFFIDDPAVVEEGRRYLLAIGVLEIFLGWEVVFEESLGAVGDSRLALLVATPLTLARIPAAWWFGVKLGYGPGAVWWVISVSTFLKGVGLALAFRFGPWRARGSVVSSLR